MKQSLFPMMIFPYAVCVCMACLFSEFAMVNFFGGDLINMLIVLVILWCAAFVADVFYVYGIKSGKRRSRRVFKEQITVKVIQIPAYIAMLGMGTLMVSEPQLLVQFGTMAYLSLILSGIVCTYAIFRHYKHNNISAERCVWSIVCQFMFVSDIISIVPMYIKARKRRRRRHRGVKYTVKKITGKYAYIANEENKEVFVAMSLLPVEVAEGAKLYYDAGQYVSAE